mmetsp:Transcript_11145/g.12553  ORF Transcript_11145/g.12553 Transcript_11145/m.12553 type:complete len:213 (+) Transcript_11145:2328-2966(+)
MKWYCAFMSLVLILEYCSALANLSYLNSPSVFPAPFDDRGVDPPIQVPLYSYLKSPFTEVVKSGPDQGELRPTKWAFYLGFIISEYRLNLMWVEWLMLLLLYYFFVYFYSSVFESTSLNFDNEDKIVKAVQQDLREQKIFNSDQDENGSALNKSVEDEFVSRSSGNIPKSKASEMKEAIAYINKIREKMWLYKIYSFFSGGVSATSTILFLV